MSIIVIAIKTDAIIQDALLLRLKNNLEPQNLP